MNGCCKTLCSLLIIFGTNHANANQDCETNQQHYFSWAFVDACAMQPRGGTTTGAAVNRVTEATAEWQALQAADTAFERDRRAILAMAGPYRASFSFLETLGYAADFTPAQPYFSWATEYVYVIEDRGDFISLQHIMAMVFEDADGNQTEPVVMKHWRQDWQYEDTLLAEFVGNETWQRTTTDNARRNGRWSQSVYHVDDSPRYEGFGEWQHSAEFSQWQSDATRRPTPRRERSVRSDYDYLHGINKHIVLPTGWVHEQHNYKMRGSPGNEQPIAKEIGINRYDRITDHNFAPADEYWQNTQSYWQDVRSIWADILSKHSRSTLQELPDQARLFHALFQGAERFAGENYHAEQSRDYILTTINKRLVTE